MPFAQVFLSIIEEFSFYKNEVLYLKSSFSKNRSGSQGNQRFPHFNGLCNLKHGVNYLWQMAHWLSNSL